MKLTLPILTIAATIFASGAFAFEPDDFQKLLDTGECVKCDLSDIVLLPQPSNMEGFYANLEGANLENANLMGAFLHSANLEGANLENALLANAILHGANLEGANLNYAYMNGAILCNTTMPDGSVIYSGC